MGIVENVENLIHKAEDAIIKHHEQKHSHLHRPSNEPGSEGGVIDANRGNPFSVGGQGGVRGGSDGFHFPPESGNGQLHLGPGPVKLPPNQGENPLPMGPGPVKLPPHEGSAPMGPGPVKPPPTEGSLPMGPGPVKPPPTEGENPLPMGPGPVKPPPNQGETPIPLGPGPVIIPNEPTRPNNTPGSEGGETGGSKNM
ncbi:hypothetical protein M231_02815 [Tremella mesenterica]|uniref:Uncharacterized protein n=1 Tax=Tremella mesenterica TaxID=5217 RepID=A0A4Q1BPP8_TREME|nr:hypothetical protein M231_02815 [Tremella mesenterica]